MSESRFFATCSKGLEYLLVDELKAIGANQAREALAGVHFSGAATLGLRACLWSRLASRILLPLAEFEAGDAEALYAGVHGIDWRDHLDPGRSFAIDATVRLSNISQGMFAGQKAKDAIVDQMRRHFGERPDVDTDAPDVRINLRLLRNLAVLSIDLSATPLHRRGWRSGQGEAPLKETVAAAMLLRAGWPELAAQGGALLDPFCGVGTVVIEAAWMATDTAPGLLRGQFGCRRWLGFDDQVGQQLLHEARERRAHGMAQWPGGHLHGADLNARLVEQAREHARRAGVADRIEFRHSDARRKRTPEPVPDLVIANLPFGERLGDDDSTRRLYREFGQTLRDHYPASSRAALLTLADGRGKALGLRAKRRYALSNGALDCELLLIDLNQAPRAGTLPLPRPLSEGAQMVANRLRKNHKHLHKRLQREGITCYRVYDADLPEYAAAIDLYEGHAVIQEYQAPVEIPAETARRRLGEIVRAVQDALALPRDHVVVKQRHRQRAGDQYQARDAPWIPAPITVSEAGLRFEIRLDDYLDTGLYLDHRLVRQWLGAHAAGKDFLNLFCYTATASVHAAAGGARSTTSVDLSPNYLAWAQRNLTMNGHAGPAHRLVRADVMRWLASVPDRYDLIYVDPPTFSNSKRADDFDVQRQHGALLHACGDHLKPGGTIIFSNHFRKFKLDMEGLGRRFAIQDMGPRMLPFDFARDPRIHQVFELRLQTPPGHHPT